MSQNPQSLWNASADAWMTRLEKGDINRTHLLDPIMLLRASDVTGKKVVDIGCGEGRFSRMLGQRGAFITGIDPTPAFIERAQSLDPAGRYIVSGGESLPLEDDEFDLTVCYVVLIDIEDYQSAIAEMVRVTRPGGRILIANLNPSYTATDEQWTYNKEKSQVDLPIANYFDARGVRVRWCGIDVINYHRPLRDYFAAFLSHPLRLTYFEEPRPSEELLEAHPSFITARTMPYFQIFEWVKSQP